MRGTARRFAVILMAFALLAAGVPAARAESQIRVVLGGQELTFDVPPALVNGRVLVPLRKIFETLGAKVAYDQATKHVTAVKGPISVELTIDKDAVRIDGETKKLDVPPQVVDGRTLVPVRFVSEALGGQVSWDPASRTVSIISPQGTVNPADMILAAKDLPGGKWTELESPGELPDGYMKAMVSNDPAEPYAWLSNSLKPVGEGADAWVQDRTCREDETEIAPPPDLLFGNTAKFCQSSTPQGLVVSVYIAAGEYVLTMAAGPRSAQTTVDDALTTLEGLALHQLILLGKLARGQERPAPLAAMPAKVEQPAGSQPPDQQPAGQPEQPTGQAENPAGQPEQPPVLQPVGLPPAPAPLEFSGPTAALRATPGPKQDPTHVIHSFCAPQPGSLTSPCGPMPATTDPKGGNPPYHFVLGTGGGFPPMGVKLLKDGHLTGVPTMTSAGKDFKFTVCAVDLSANRVCHDVTLSVGQPDVPPLQFVAPTLAKATVDRQYAASVGTATGGRPPYQYTVQGEGLPSGLWLSTDGTLQGWPNEGTGGKTHTFTVCATDAAQQQACADVSLQVDPRPPTLAEQFQNTAWTGTFTLNFERFGTRSGTVDFTIGPDTGDTTLSITNATVSLPGWQFKFNHGWLQCINDHSCQGLYLDFDLLDEQSSSPSDIGWWVRGLSFQVDIDIESDSAPAIVDAKGVTHQMTTTAMKGVADAYSLNPPGTFSVTRR